MFALLVFSSHISEKREPKHGLTCQMLPASPPLPKIIQECIMMFSRLFFEHKKYAKFLRCASSIEITILYGHGCLLLFLPK